MSPLDRLRWLADVANVVNHPAALKLSAVLAYRSGDGESRRSVKTLAEEAGLSRRGAQKGLRYLEEQGFIRAEATAGGRSVISVYRLQNSEPPFALSRAKKTESARENSEPPFALSRAKKTESARENSEPLFAVARGERANQQVQKGEPAGPKGRTTVRTEVVGKGTGRGNPAVAGRDLFGDTPETRKPPQKQKTQSGGQGRNGKPNVWGRWIDAHRERGLGEPMSEGADTAASARIGKAILDADELAFILRAYLDDQDSWLTDHGHPLRYLPKRATKYRSAYTKHLDSQKRLAELVGCPTDPEGLPVLAKAEASPAPVSDEALNARLEGLARG